MMMVLQRRDGTTRPLTVQWWVGWLTLAALAGGLATNGLTWIGNAGRSPNVRMTALETADTALAHRIDQRIDGLAVQLDITTDLVEMLVAMRCAESDSVRIAVVAQVPCARIQRDRGLRP